MSTVVEQIANKYGFKKIYLPLINGGDEFLYEKEIDKKRKFSLELNGSFRVIEIIDGKENEALYQPNITVKDFEEILNKTI